MQVDLQRAAASDGGLRRICSFRPEGALVRCTTDSSEILIPCVPASHLRTSDVLWTGGPHSPVREFLAAPSSRHNNSKQLYFGRIGYAARPKSDKRDEFFVRAEVLESGLGIRALHLSNAAVSDYFYRLGQKPGEPTLYDILKVTRTASPADLRLSYRLRRIELETSEACKLDLQRTERAFNLLAHPELRSCYDALLQDPNAPAAFPYGGFGQCVVAGELAADGNTFFVRRILAYLPNQCQRQFRAPLRRIEYLNKYALYRDGRRKAEVYLDRTLLPISWDPTWNQWKHLIGANIGIAGTFVESGEYRLCGGVWRLIQWQTALPSRLFITLPANTETSLASARRAYRRFGEFHDGIERIRIRLDREPLDEVELTALSRSLGIPADFDIAQFCWKPDYDPYFYQELKKRSQNVYFFRDEFVFQLARAIVAEIPQLGHATYIFAIPADVGAFVRRYSQMTRDDIRKNRGNVADQLGFIGRIMHGGGPRKWLRDFARSDWGTARLLGRRGGTIKWPFRIRITAKLPLLSGSINGQRLGFHHRWRSDAAIVEHDERWPALDIGRSHYRNRHESGDGRLRLGRSRRQRHRQAPRLVCAPTRVSITVQSRVERPKSRGGAVHRFD